MVLQPKREALQEAKQSQADIVLWTDGSRLDVGKAGAAVVWFDDKLDKWQEKRRFLGKNKDSFDAELWAILEAFILSISPTTVTVFTDLQAAIKKILEPEIRLVGTRFEILFIGMRMRSEMAGIP